MDKVKLQKLFSRGFRKKLFGEYSIFFFLLILPFAYQLIKFVPQSELIEVFGISAGDFGFKNVNVFFWFLAQKIIPLSVIIIWFITSRSWWRYSLIVPILFIVTQTFQLFIGNRFTDENEFFYAFPIALPIVIGLVYLSRKVNLYIANYNLKTEFHNEIDLIAKAVAIDKVEIINENEIQLLRLKSTKYYYPNESYLKKLLNFRDGLQSEKNQFSCASINNDGIERNYKSLQNYTEYFVAFFILLSPILFYLYLLIPESPQLSVFDKVISMNYQETFRILGWLILVKLNYISLYAIWFLYNKEWWRISLLPLLAYEIYLLFVIINDEIGVISNPISLINEIIIIILLILVLFFLGERIKKKSLSILDNFTIETDELLKRISKCDKKVFNLFSQKLSSIQKNRLTMTDSEYLHKLLILQEAMILIEAEGVNS